MTTILKQLSGIRSADDAYRFGEVTGISDNFLTVKTTSGLEVRVGTESSSYSIGDQVVLGIQGSSLNNLFVLKKLNKVYPNAINYLIDLDQD